MKNKPIRIAQIIGKMSGGGVEAVIMNYYKNIDKEKVQFDFIVDEDSSYIPEDEIKSMGGRIYIVPKYQTIHKYIPALIKLLKKNNYRIVHSHMNTLSIFSMFAAKIAGVPIRIAHNHSTAGKGELKKNILKYSLRPFSKIFPTHFFACSEYAGRWLFGNKFYNNGNVKIMNNAIDSSKFKYDENIRKELRKELELENKFVVGHIGRFMKQKNHDFLIEIFNEVAKLEDNAVFLLIGTGPLLENIKTKVDNLGLNKKVKFLGFRNDIHKIMLAMDVFVLPSFYEGLPVVSMEAQASALKMIASEAITKESWITEFIEFKSINESPKMWAEAVLKYKDGYFRRDTSDDIKRAGYEIKPEADKLCDYYINTQYNIVNKNIVQRGIV